LPLPEDTNSQEATIGQGNTSPYRKDLALSSDVASNDTDLTEHDAYLMAKSFFDLKEYDRCASVLEGYSSNKSRFLRLYSRYLVSGDERTLLIGFGRIFVNTLTIGYGNLLPSL
jgi:anaphase-promoting complex subunit 8